MKKQSILLLILCGTLILPADLSFGQTEEDISTGDIATVNVTKANQTKDSGESESGAKDEVAMQDQAAVTIIKAGEEEKPPKETLGLVLSDILSIYHQQRQETLQIIKDCRAELNNSDPNDRSDVRQQCREQLNELKEQYKEVRKSIRDAIIVFKDTYKMSIRDAAENPPDDSKLDKNEEMIEKMKNTQTKIRQFQSGRG